MEFHSVYLQRRQPGVSYRDFQRLWRSHGDFAASIPAFWDHVRRYIHNDPVEDTAGLPGQTATYDAVGELFYPDYETWVSLREVMWDQVAPDEKRVFNGPSTAVRGGRTAFIEPKGLFKLFTFVRLRPGIAPEAVDGLLREHAARTLDATGFARRLSGFTVTRAHRNDAATQMDSRPQTASNMDVVFIHHFPNEVSARAALTDADYVRVQHSEDSFLDFASRVAVLTHGWVLKGTPV